MRDSTPPSEVAGYQREGQSTSDERRAPRTHHEQLQAVSEPFGVDGFRGREGKAGASLDHLLALTDQIRSTFLQGSMPDLIDHSFRSIESRPQRRASKRRQPLGEGRRRLCLTQHPNLERTE